MRSTVNKEEAVLLTEDHIYFGGMNLTYRLSVQSGVHHRRFFISIQKADERAQAEVGSDLLRAMQYYRRLVDGTVTPCTLDEVLQELQYA